jgi:hypothetical protein
VVLVSYDQSTDRVRTAALATLLRSAVLLLPVTLLLGLFWPEGFWWLFLAAEGLTLAVMVPLQRYRRKKEKGGRIPVLTCTMTNDNRELGAILEEVEAFCADNEVPPGTGMQMQLAVEELCAVTMAQAFSGEDLNILVGSLPFDDGDPDSNAFKLNVMNILHEQYGIVESDLISAEISFVPAFKAVDIGFDRSMVGAYGHDDRVCSYPALQAILDVKTPEHTVITCLADKEEIGSVGNTGLASEYLDYFVADLAEAGSLRAGCVVVYEREGKAASLEVAGLDLERSKVKGTTGVDLYRFCDDGME